MARKHCCASGGNHINCSLDSAPGQERQVCAFYFENVSDHVNCVVIELKMQSEICLFEAFCFTVVADIKEKQLTI